MSATQSVLDAMTESIMGVKQDKATQLTPVGREAGGPLAGVRTGEMFPNDLPQEVLEDKLRDLDRIINHLVQAREALKTLIGKSEPAPVPDVKAAEAEADRLRWEEKKAAAQAAVFGEAAVVDELTASVIRPEATTLVGWSCPTHGTASLTKLTSRKGREYLSCTECEEFEK